MQTKQETETKQKDDEAAKKKKEEEEAKKKEEEELENSLTDEQKKAGAEKDLGNAAFKAKDFETALAHYDAAIALFPKEMVYYTNKGSVYFAQKKYEECIAECEKAIELRLDGYYDYEKLAKAHARKANALSKLERYDEAIEAYDSARLEHNDYKYKDGLKKIQNLKKESEAKAYINPEIAEEHRVKGNELFKEGKFPAAIKEYDEGLRRDPVSVKIFSNRALAYVKLMEYPTAMKDVEKGLSLEPENIKLIARKGNIHHSMREYHKAIQTFDEGLKLDPTNKDCSDGKYKTMAAVQSGAHAGAGPENEEEAQQRLQHAMADPEIQGLMKDPRIIQVLKEMQENPMAA